MLIEMGSVRGSSGSTSSRKYYLDRVLTVLLSFPMKEPDITKVVNGSVMVRRPQCSRAEKLLPEFSSFRMLAQGAASARDLKYEPKEFQSLIDVCAQLLAWL
jgi:hypothetical protein